MKGDFFPAMDLDQFSKTFAHVAAHFLGNLHITLNSNIFLNWI
jgi:hypothetical protein